jgi:hypothetical protein
VPGFAALQHSLHFQRDRACGSSNGKGYMS